MKHKVLRGSVVAAIALVMGGCSLLDMGGETRGANNGLIPPSAQPRSDPPSPPNPQHHTKKHTRAA